MGDIHFTFIQHHPTANPQEPTSSAQDAEGETEDNESGSKDLDDPIDWEPEQPPPPPAPLPALNPAFPASNYLGRPLQVNQGNNQTTSTTRGTLTLPPEVPTAPARLFWLTSNPFHPRLDLPPAAHSLSHPVKCCFTCW